MLRPLSSAVKRVEPAEVNREESLPVGNDTRAPSDSSRMLVRAAVGIPQGTAYHVCESPRPPTSPLFKEHPDCSFARHALDARHTAMSDVTIDGLRVCYEVVGEGPLVVLLHGWGGRIASMGPIRDALRAEYTVVSVDLPGFGESDTPSETWGSAEYGTAVGGALRAAGFPRALCVAGHSFGGKVAVHLALGDAIAVDSLLLVGTPGARLPLSEETRRRIARVKRAKKLAALLPGPLRRSIEGHYAKLGSEDYRNASGRMREILVKTVNEDIRDLLPGIAVPTLLIFGANDTATPPEIGRIMEEKIAGSGLVVMDGSGHFPYLDEPAAFNAVARSFLASVRQGAASTEVPA